MEKTPLFEKIKKSISKILKVKLNKIYAPSSRFDDQFKGNDITFFTNKKGEPYALLIGQRNKRGNISGQYFSRRIKKREGDKIILSHWDNQGKVSGKHPNI